MSTPETPIESSGSTEPARNTGIAVALGALVLDALTYFGLPTDDFTKLVVTAVVSVAAPALAALLIRFKAWAPASVAKLQADLLALISEAAAENPPTVVTNAALNPTQAAEAHPGGLGLPSYGPNNHGRHERAE